MSPVLQLESENSLIGTQSTEFSTTLLESSRHPRILTNRVLETDEAGLKGQRTERARAPRAACSTDGADGGAWKTIWTTQFELVSNSFALSVSSVHSVSRFDCLVKSETTETRICHTYQAVLQLAEHFASEFVPGRCSKSEGREGHGCKGASAE